MKSIKEFLSSILVHSVFHGSSIILSDVDESKSLRREACCGEEDERKSLQWIFCRDVEEDWICGEEHELDTEDSSSWMQHGEED